MPSQPTCGCRAWARTRSALACRALPPPRASTAAAGPSSRGERSRSAAAHADPCPPPPPQAALAAAPGPAEAGMLEKLEFQEEGECATRALRCRRRAPGLQPAPGEAPVCRDAARILGTKPRSGSSTRPRGSSRVPGDAALFSGCNLVPEMEPGFRGHSLAPGMPSGSQRSGRAPGDAAPFQGTQPRSRGRNRVPRERSLAPGSGRPRAPRDGPFVLRTRTRARARCHAALIVHVTVRSQTLRNHTRTAHAFK